MPKPVNGQASWPDSLESKYETRDKLIAELKEVQAEISAIELVMLIQEMGGSSGNAEAGVTRS